jgi:hypothetical protein
MKYENFSDTGLRIMHGDSLTCHTFTERRPNSITATITIEPKKIRMMPPAVIPGTELRALALNEDNVSDGRASRVGGAG